MAQAESDQGKGQRRAAARPCVVSCESAQCFGWLNDFAHFFWDNQSLAVLAIAD